MAAGVEMINMPSEAVLGPQTMVKTISVNDRFDGMRVLLAEDGPDNQKLISFLIQRTGAKVTVAGNGRIAHDQAVAAVARDEPFDLILMDMQMPELDGYGATALLRQEGYAGPIVALTAHAMADDRQRCLDAGCNDYLTKPIDRPKLFAKLRAHAPKTVTAVG
jgi:CheY-like chemotaxis protein